MSSAGDKDATSDWEQHKPATDVSNVALDDDYNYLDDFRDDHSG